MAVGHIEPQGYFHAPLAEKLDDELIWAIKNDRVDAQACREQLHKNGWKDEWIDERVGR